MTRFLRRVCSPTPPDLLLRALKDPLKGAVVLGAPQRQHHVGPLRIPPCPRAFEPHMVNELVSRFDPSTPYGVTPPAQGAILRTFLIFLEVTPKLPDRLGRLFIPGLHPLQVQQYPVQRAEE